MITNPTFVFPASELVTTSKSAFALTKGQAAFVDAEFKVVADPKNAEYAVLCVGTFTAEDGSTKAQLKVTNKLSELIAKAETAYVAPVEAKAEIELAGATVVAGHRYVIRIVYKDLYEAPGQFSHTYEVVASDNTAASLLAAFKKQITKHPNRRANVVVAGTKMTLTAMPKDDNEGIDSLNEYSIVSMAVTMYETVPGALLSNQPVKFGTITVTEGNPGNGYWKQVRDLEVRNQGYQGHIFTDAYPVIAPKMLTEEGAEYDKKSYEFNTKYLSPDNQYEKETKTNILIFVKKN